MVWSSDLEYYSDLSILTVSFGCTIFNAHGKRIICANYAHVPLKTSTYLALRLLLNKNKIFRSFTHSSNHVAHATTTFEVFGTICRIIGDFLVVLFSIFFSLTSYLQIFIYEVNLKFKNFFIPLYIERYRKLFAVWYICIALYRIGCRIDKWAWAWIITVILLCGKGQYIAHRPCTKYSLLIGQWENREKMDQT